MFRENHLSESDVLLRDVNKPLSIFCAFLLSDVYEISFKRSVRLFLSFMKIGVRQASLPCRRK